MPRSEKHHSFYMMLGVLGICSCNIFKLTTRSLCQCLNSLVMCLISSLLYEGVNLNGLEVIHIFIGNLRPSVIANDKIVIIGYCI